MNFYTYLQTVKLRAAPLPLDKQLEHAALGMISEAGELADLYKRQLAYGKDFDPVNLLEECGDWVWYFGLEVLTLAEMHGWEPQQLDHLSARVDEAAREWKEVQMPDSALLTFLRGLSLAKNWDYRNFYGEQALYTVICFLNSCGFTFEQCLDANDAKLEKRTGKKFSAEAVLNRDTGAERTILEQHAEHGTNPSAG